MGEHTYQHLIPKVYLKAWRNNPSAKKEDWEVWSVDKNTSIAESLLLANSFGKEHHYDLDINSISKYLLKSKNCLFADDLKAIFAPLKDYSVSINGEKVTDHYVFAEMFSKYDEWTIYDAEINEIPIEIKERLKNEIVGIKIQNVEKSWDKEFENHWHDTVEKIVHYISNSRNNPIGKHEEFIKRFAISLEWRGERASEIFESKFKELADIILEMVVGDKTDFSDNLAEMRHLYLICNYRLLFKNKGLLHEEIKLIKEKNIDFLVAPDSTFFLTSDRPCFLDNNLKEMILPITPKILLRFVRQTSNPRKYTILKVDEEEVQKYNNAIVNNCVNFYIKIQ